MIHASEKTCFSGLVDAYYATLTNEVHRFAGSLIARKESCTTQIIAMCGADQVAASVVASEITKPAGVTVSVDTNTTAPTLTISVDTSMEMVGEIVIPVHIEDIVIKKKFSFVIKF